MGPCCPALLGTGPLQAGTALGCFPSFCRHWSPALAAARVLYTQVPGPTFTNDSLLSCVLCTILLLQAFSVAYAVLSCFDALSIKMSPERVFTECVTVQARVSCPASAVLGNHTPLCAPRLSSQVPHGQGPSCVPTPASSRDCSWHPCCLSERSPSGKTTHYAGMTFYDNRHIGASASVPSWQV